MLDLAREHADPLAEGQDPLTVDRQRVVHAAAFRRLQHKTQVFVAPESDHFRSRLTHTLEVAHLARGLADALHLDAALAEVVALAHDLGHPPFGHAGETALAACLADHGGFEHNQHTLRVVEWLEHPYPEFRGLNLTRAVRACLARHSTPYDRPGPHPLQDDRPAPPESAVVDLADRLTYALHDLQDGLYAGLVEPASLNALGLWQATYAGPALDAPNAWHGHLRPAVDRMQRRVLDDVARHFAAGATVGVSVEMDAQLNALDRLLHTQVYRSEMLQHADEHARRILAAVFDALRDNPAQLPERFRRRLDDEGLVRVVTDYVAGMTDRYCLQEYTRLCAD